MSIDKNVVGRSLVVSLAVSALTACGVGSTPVSTGGEQALVPAERPPALERLTPTAPVSQVAAGAPLQVARLAAVRPNGASVVAHSLAVPDGTQVEFILGMIGCGFWEVASGTATVVDGAFEVPFDAEQTGGIDAMSLYFRTATAACDADDPATQLHVVGAPLPGAVDVSSAELVGCSVFGW